MKKCPYCAEEIQDEAIVCRYCGKEISALSIPVIISRLNLKVIIPLTFLGLVAIGAVIFAVTKTAMPKAAPLTSHELSCYEQSKVYISWVDSLLEEWRQVEVKASADGNVYSYEVMPSDQDIRNRAAILTPPACAQAAQNQLIAWMDEYIVFLNSDPLTDYNDYNNHFNNYTSLHNIFLTTWKNFSTP